MCLLVLAGPKVTRRGTTKPNIVVFQSSSEDIKKLENGEIDKVDGITNGVCKPFVDIHRSARNYADL